MFGNKFIYGAASAAAAVFAFVQSQKAKARQAKSHRTGRGVRDLHKAGGRSWAPHQVRKVWNSHV